MSVQNPKISIVTPSFNQGDYIEETICSILDQNYSNLEYIIIDGGSNDQTLEIIKKYEKHLSYWVSEKDSGQSNAINKGLQRCTGDLFNWINSDDIVEKETLNTVAQVFREKGAHCIAGNIQVFGDESWLYDAPVKRESHLSTLKNIKIKQPSTYYSMSAINKMGPLNESLHYIMDYEWYVRFLLTHKMDDISEVDQVFSRFRLHGLSKTGSDIEAFEEHKDEFWKTVFYWKKGQIDHVNFKETLYRDELIDEVIADFFYKRAVIAYGNRSFNVFRQYAALVDVDHLSDHEKSDLRKMHSRSKLIPKFLFKK